MSGRLLACVSSRPGQVGRCGGYILEGKELGFYSRKLSRLGMIVFSSAQLWLHLGREAIILTEFCWSTKAEIGLQCRLEYSFVSLVESDCNEKAAYPKNTIQFSSDLFENFGCGVKVSPIFTLDLNLTVDDGKRQLLVSQEEEEVEEVINSAQFRLIFQAENGSTRDLSERSYLIFSEISKNSTDTAQSSARPLLRMLQKSSKNSGWIQRSKVGMDNFALSTICPFRQLNLNEE
nr:small subunit ribosomal protein 8 [Hymenolepis microstoma]